VDKMNDPDEAHRLTQERITKLERDKEQVERLVEKEQARAEESSKNKQITKRLAEEERRKRLEVEAEVHELKAKLGLLGHS
jgi:hypothetical protein